MDSITPEIVRARGRTYQKEALALGFPTTDGNVYAKGGWSIGTGYQSGVPIPPEAVSDIKMALGKVGLDGAQVIPEAHFTMTDVLGNVYGCVPGGVEQSRGETPNPHQPLAYENALSEASIEEAVAGLCEANSLTGIQAEAVRMALNGVKRKAATQVAFQVTLEDVASGRNRVVTLHGDNTETDIRVPEGGWVTLQANGEVQYIEESKWAKLGFHPID